MSSFLWTRSQVLWSVHHPLWPWLVLTACTRQGAYAHALFALCATEETSGWWTHSAIPEPHAHVHSNPWCFQTCWARLRMARTIHRPERGGRYSKLLFSVILTFKSHWDASFVISLPEMNHVFLLYFISVWHLSRVTLSGSSLPFVQIYLVGFLLVKRSHIYLTCDVSHTTNHYYKPAVCTQSHIP